MKNFIIAILAIIIFLIGLISVLCEIFGLLDPEGYDKPVLYFFAITAVISFLVSWLLWKLSRQK